MAARTYGMSIFRNGVQLRSDGRPRRHLVGGYSFILRPRKSAHFRGKVRGWSERSARRLRFITHNADVFFRSLVTLTYHALAETWETNAERNRRVIERSAADRHRFLRCLADETGAYLWVREFQRRGVVHFHVLCEREVLEGRATEVWCRASDQWHDPHVLRHGVKVDAIRSQQGAAWYVGKYIGKEKQKELPAGVDGAGRWWGRSRSLRLAHLSEIVWLNPAEGWRYRGSLQIVRILRRFISRRFGRKYRGGAFVDLGGELSAKLHKMAGQLREHYPDEACPEFLKPEQWEEALRGVKEWEWDGEQGRVLEPSPEQDSRGNGGEAGRGAGAAAATEAGRDDGRAVQTSFWED